MSELEGYLNRLLISISTRGFDHSQRLVLVNQADETPGLKQKYMRSDQINVNICSSFLIMSIEHSILGIAHGS